MGTQFSSPPLPHEILSKIFIYAKSDNTFDELAPQWVAGMVSRRWRDVSLGTPQLWNTVKVMPSRDQPRERRRSIREYDAMLEVALRRSGGRILHVDVDVTNFDPAGFRDFLTILFTTSDNWKTLALRNAHYKSRPEWEIEWDTSGFPSLQAITIDDLGTFTQSQRLLLALENSPKLESVALFRREFHPFDTSPNLPSLPYQQLTLLEVDPPQEPWCLQALERCEKLSTLILRRDVVLALDAIRPSSPITLPAVRCLQLSLNGNSDARSHSSSYNILNLLSLPSLTEISVSEGDNSTGSSLIDTLIHLIDRSPSCSISLQSISIRDIALSDHTIERLLSKTPNVTRLSLHGLLFPRMFTSLASLPNLRHLTVSQSDKYGAFPSSSTVAAITDVMGTLESLHLNIHTNSIDRGPVEKLRRKARVIHPRLDVSVDYLPDSEVPGIDSDSDSSGLCEIASGQPRYRSRRLRTPVVQLHTRVEPVVDLIRRFVEMEEMEPLPVEEIAESLPLLDDILTVVDDFDVDYSDCADDLHYLQSFVDWDAYPWNVVPHIQGKLAGLLEWLQ
ncbi:hypothetical protein AAF712_012303 [Marasmius tenuissimus]|uniref:F-box domain-containing protein n=1 Tax=Marasmius tenuissimus TaxID=585030 RepID=A0ABR2ZHS3_9AGAR